MSALRATLLTPALEGLIRPGHAERVDLRVSGSQSFSHDAGGIQLVGFGRIRLDDPQLRQRAVSAGMGAALAQGWAQAGERLPALLGGEFVLMIWEPATRRALIAVDRFNTFPLYWGEQGGRLAVANRPQQVCELLGCAAELDARALHAYGYFHVIPAPLSIYRGVSRLDMAQAVVVARGHSAVHTYWTPCFVEDAPFDPERERDMFREALRIGVSECIEGVAPEQLGCFLSGGTDSSTIAGLVSQIRGGAVRTFSIGFDVEAYDERAYSRLAAAHFGTRHTEHVLSPGEVGRAIDALAQACEQPFGNASAIPTYACAALAREAGITRMLGGDGGDELYGGNERYATQWLFSLYDRLPRRLRTGVLEPALLGPLSGIEGWPVGKARSYVAQARLPLPERLGSRYNLLNRFGAERVFSDALLAGGAFDPLALEREVWARSPAAGQLNRLLAFDFKFTLGDNDLPKVTRMCHAAGVEVAFPLLTTALTDHSLRLPPGQKLKGRRLRHFFKESLRGFLPEAIISKPKHGFGMPFGDWVLAQPALAAQVRDALGSLATRGLVRPAFLDEIQLALRSGHAGYYGTMVWVLMSLELWIRAHGDTRLSLSQS